MAKPSILFIIHAFENRGGTEEHSKILAEGVTDHFTPVFLFPQTKTPTGFTLLEENQKRFIECEISAFPLAPYNHYPSEKIVRNVIEEIKPTLIHIQHWLYWHTGLIEQVCNFKIPTVLSLHDYFLFSPEFTLSHGNIQDSLTPAYALKVFGEDCSIFLGQRQRALIQALQKPDRIIVPSSFLERVITPYRYPQTIEHGIRPFLRKEKLPSKTLRIGYVGSFLPQKGSETLISLGAQWHKFYPSNPIQIFGAKGESQGLKFRGPYDQGMRAEIFGELDVLLIPSLFNETYSLVLSEGWNGGCYPVVSNMGALKERVNHGVNGEIFEAGNSFALFSTLQKLLLNENLESFTPPEVRLADEMVRDYLELYSELTR